MLSHSNRHIRYQVIFKLLLFSFCHFLPFLQIPKCFLSNLLSLIEFHFSVEQTGTSLSFPLPLGNLVCH